MSIIHTRARNRGKSFERRICKRFGLTRTGPTGLGDPDCVKGKGWSIEARKRADLPFTMIVDQVAKAEARAAVGDIPISIAARPGTKDEDAIVSMRLGTFEKFFRNQPQESE